MKIAVVTSHTTEINHMAKKTLANKAAYCFKHKYSLLSFCGRLSDRHPSWDKIVLMKSFLLFFDWCFWMDSDCIFNNFSKRLENAFQGNGIFIRDFASNETNKDKQLINAGAFGLRNCPESFLLLDSVWNTGKGTMAKEITKRSYDGWPWEQAGLCQHILTSKEFHVLPDMDMNCHPSLATSDTHIIHYMGWRATQESEDQALADIDRRNLVLL